MGPGLAGPTAAATRGRAERDTRLGGRPDPGHSLAAADRPVVAAGRAPGAPGLRVGPARSGHLRAAPPAPVARPGVSRAGTWPPCRHSGCPGAGVYRGRCLGHLETAELDRVLAQPSEELDGRGVAVTPELIDRIAAAERALDREVHFDRARFEGGVSFAGLRFGGPAVFVEAVFTGFASFTETRFDGGGDFSAAEFAGPAWFGAAEFAGEAGGRFEWARFRDPASFARSRFTAASFAEARFDSTADFQATTCAE